MAVTRDNYNELMRPGARKVFVDEYDELPAIYPLVTNIESSTQAFEDEHVTTGLPRALRRPEGEPIPFDRPYYRGKVRYTHTGYGLGYEVVEEAFDDEQYGVLSAQGSTNLARSLRETEEIVNHRVFNLGGTTFQTYDGAPLFSTTHQGVGGLEFSNTPGSATELSVTALKAAMENYMKMQNDRGLRIMMRPRHLFVPVENWWTAREILGTQFRTLSTDDDDAMNSEYGLNVTQEMGLTPIQSPFLLDEDSWFLLPDKGRHHIRMYWRKAPMPVDDFDKRNRFAWFGIIARFSHGVTDWRGLYGNVTGAT